MSCCSSIQFPDGTRAIVCSRGTKVPACGSCDREAAYQCDWKLPGVVRRGKPATCDARICPDHAQEVAPDKHLCPAHLIEYRAWQAKKPATPLATGKAEPSISTEGSGSARAAAPCTPDVPQT